MVICDTSRLVSLGGIGYRSWRASTVLTFDLSCGTMKCFYFNKFTFFEKGSREKQQNGLVCHQCNIPVK